MAGNIYKQKWDKFAKTSERRNGFWPGDQWGTPERWEVVFAQLFRAYGVEVWNKAIEIGAGAGKYSIKVLNASSTEILSADISEEYQRICQERLTLEGVNDRVHYVVLNDDYRTLYREVVKIGWNGKVDAFFSIDAMVHVDLQYVVVYMITANRVLRPHGKLIMTVANSCSDLGFKKLVGDIPEYYRYQGAPSAKFEWLSPQSVTNLLSRLGFKILHLDDSQRDIRFVAEKSGDAENWIVETVCM